jgi:hypothetical protein
VFECRPKRFNNFLTNYLDSASDVIISDINMSVCTGITGNPGLSRIGGAEWEGSSYIFGKMDSIMMLNKSFWWECREFFNLYGFPNLPVLRNEFPSFDFEKPPTETFFRKLDYKVHMPELMAKLTPVVFTDVGQLWGGDLGLLKKVGHYWSGADSMKTDVRLTRWHECFPTGWEGLRRMLETGEINLEFSSLESNFSLTSVVTKWPFVVKEL